MIILVAAKHYVVGVVIFVTVMDIVCKSQQFTTNQRNPMIFLFLSHYIRKEIEYEGLSPP